MEKLNSSKPINDLYLQESSNGYYCNFEEVKLLYCGKEECKPGDSFGPNIKDEYVIYIVLSGKGNIKIGNRKCEIVSGEAFLFRPGEVCSYQADETDPWTFFWLGFVGNRSNHLLSLMGFSEENNVISLIDTNDVEEKINTILRCQALTISNELKRQGSFYNTLGALIEFSQVEEKIIKEEKIDSIYVSKAIELITKNYNKKLKVQEIANKIGVNRSYLTNLFKKSMGVSPQNFLIDYRLEKSTQLLKETQNSMVDIALEVGYSDSLAFSKAFKQKFGVSPSQYRKNNL